MKTRRTKEEIYDIQAFATKVGLDGRVARFCKTKDQVEKLFVIQEKMNDRCSVSFNLKHITPKEKVKEYEAAIEHKESLAAYLSDSGQLEALEALRKVKIEENEPRFGKFINGNKKYITEELENLHFSKTNIKEIVSIFIEYLRGEYQDEYCEFGSGSIYKQVRKQITEGISIPIIKSKY